MRPSLAALTVMVLAACGRSPAADACPAPGPRIVWSTTFEDPAAVAVAGDARVLVQPGNARSGSSFLNFVGDGSARIAWPIDVASSQVGVGFWFRNSMSGQIRVQLSTDNGATFIDSDTAPPTFSENRVTWNFTRFDFELEAAPARVVAALSATGFSLDFDVDDLEVVELESCTPDLSRPAPVVSDDGMVLVPANNMIPAFWIDRWEAMVNLDQGLGSYDQGSAPDFNDGTTVARALARAGVRPRTSITSYQARNACRNVGKRLCTDNEFERACRGDDGLLYPYGDTYEPSTCDDAAWTDFGTTGERSGCVSPFGVYDLVGNVAELIDTDDSFQRQAGGDYADLSTCTGRNHLDPNNSGSSIGFRCCRDPQL